MIVRGLLLFIALTISTVAIIYATEPLWSQDRPASCLPDACFCELMHIGDTVKQPLNTWSSLAYALVGALWFFAPAKNPTGPFHNTWGVARMFAVSAIVIGVGSAYYHASLTFSGQFLDVFGMYLLTTLMLVYVWKRQYRLSMRTMWLIYAALNVLLAILLVVVPDLRRSLFALVLLLALVFEFRYFYTRRITAQIRWLHSGLALFALAYVIWLLDHSELLCDPTSLLQGHVLWHLLGASATACLFTYYASETA